MVYFEKRLSECLDDLLVGDGVLPARQVKFSNSKRGFGMVLAVKQDPRVKVKIEIYPNETEEPHFKVTYQNVTCRFKIVDCEPMKAESKNGMAAQGLFMWLKALKYQLFCFFDRTYRFLELHGY